MTTTMPPQSGRLGRSPRCSLADITGGWGGGGGGGGVSRRAVSEMLKFGERKLNLIAGFTRALRHLV